MIYKPSLISPIAAAYLALSTCLISTSLMAQTQSSPTPSPIPPASTSLATSNLISNNPFVPKSNGSLNKPKTTLGAQSTANKPKVLQKYLEFKSIAIINNKKYYSIFNKRTNKSFWISEGETVENFSVTYYNPKNNSISITDGINSEIIPIITANETPVSIISAPKQVGQVVATPPTSGASADQNKDKPKTLPRRRIIPVKR